MMAAAQRSQTSLDFCHNPHAASLLQGLQGLRSDNLLVDVTLCVSGKEIPCHRNVLAACSEYFRAMFCNGHRESKEHTVTIHEVSTNTLQLLVDYAYTSQVTITENNATKLLGGASFFQIHPVFDASKKFLSEHLSIQNCLEMVNVGSMLSPDLEKEALLFVLKEFAAVSKTPEFLCLTKDQLVTLISSDDLNASEETVYKAVMTWINHDTRRRKREMRELMELVRFPFMDKLFFLENVQSNEVMRKCCQHILTETLKYQVFPEEVQSPRTRPRRASGLEEAVVVIGGTEKQQVRLRRNVFSDSITMACTAEPSASSWVSLTTMRQNIDSGFAVAVLGRSDIIVSGSYGSPQEVWLYQSELDSWSELAGVNYGRYYHKLAVVQGKVYAICGDNHSTVSPLQSVEVYDRHQNKWTDGVDLPERRYCHGAAVVDGNIYVIGGLDVNDKETSTVHRFTPGDSQWQPQNDMPVKDYDIAALAHNGSIYVAGQLSKILCFQPSENGGSWSTVAIEAVGRGSGMTVYGGKIYIYGGCKEDEEEEEGGWKGNSEVLCLNPDTKSLSHVGTMPNGLFGHGCVTILKWS